jgi:hypothetical protein
VKQVRSFLGFANFYQKFIANYSDIARPLIDLTKKDVPFVWSDACEKAFSDMKQKFLSTPVLQMPDKDHPFIIAVNASLYATGGVLMTANFWQSSVHLTHGGITFKAPCSQWLCTRTTRT